ncbi:hypothetical protein FIU89_21885 (plasmid) [Roseovarius sp. THAF27]|uniref:hypothetical protein n=1 Tax=unclassified Roseovarius TaxID=2614913 RepID=UPI001267AE9C|nr:MULTISPECIES: hypothetical protein [unclassified Roseovarius]QFT83288.1 hypothetical protein FIU89_21885 [Roseovarius sp. THAF27]QFT99950.1 hypothetical protein FIU85_21700 [Roseovarius sp. THAF8]
MTDPHLILHLGAPKCASSALQAALTARPDHSASTLDRPLRYVGCRHGRSGLRPFYGAAVRALGQRSVYGYLNWPNLSPETRPAALATGLTRALDRARSLRHVPILSSEGWLAHPGWFAEELKARGNPPVDAVVYLRPPVDWINAAWWQWGIWGAPSLDAWLDRGTPLYRFGPLLEAWAAIPNLRLHIRPTRPDAVADFAALYGITLPAPSVRNAAAPPSLTGFFLRNRQFRRTAHDTAAEFVFQRWCPMPDAARSWAVLPRHVHRLRPLVAETHKRITALLPEEEAALLFADSRWQSEAGYHDRIMSGPSRPHDPAALPDLRAALCSGIENVACELGKQVPAFPPALDEGASVQAWDASLSSMFETLLALDAIWRSGTIRRLITPLWPIRSR